MWRAPTRWTGDDSQTLLEYAALFTEVVTTEGDSAEAARAGLAEIGRTSPHVLEAYAGLLLEVYGDPELECGREGAGPAAR